MDGDWDYATRKFLSAQEKLEVDRLDDLEDEANAEPVVYISKDHQRALALDTDEVSVETRVTKGDAAPPPALLDGKEDELSAMTGSTRESKAKRYADEAVKAVAAEYSGTILNMNSDIGQKDDRIAELEMLLLSLRPKTSESSPTKDDNGSTTDMDVDEVEHKEQDIQGLRNDHNNVTNGDISSPAPDKDDEANANVPIDVDVDDASDDEVTNDNDNDDVDDDTLLSFDSEPSDGDSSASSSEHSDSTSEDSNNINTNHSNCQGRKKRTLSGNEKSCSTNRTTRTKRSSLQMAVSKKSSSSEGAGNL
jgi:hypothetical protein